jgi:hypothetical protein
VASESLEQSLRQLLTQTKESYEGDYAAGEAITHSDVVLENLLRTKLVAGLHSANLRESILATVIAGGGSGEHEAQALLKTGLTGWS